MITPGLSEINKHVNLLNFIVKYAYYTLVDGKNSFLIIKSLK